MTRRLTTCLSLSYTSPSAILKPPGGCVFVLKQLSPQWLNTPYLHQVGRLPGTREIVAHPNFIVVYQVPDRIEVISVVHSRQNYP